LAFIIAGLVLSIAGVILIPAVSHLLGGLVLLAGVGLTGIGRRRQRGKL